MEWVDLQDWEVRSLNPDFLKVITISVERIQLQRAIGSITYVDVVLGWHSGNPEGLDLSEMKDARDATSSFDKWP